MEKQLAPAKVAWSGALGVYLAFSPFLGIQTILVFALSFLLRANTPIVITILYSVNNPWTMIPIVVVDYAVGAWFLRIIGIDLSLYDPSWMGWVNGKLIPYIQPYLGIKKLSLWAYLIGGHIIAIPLAIVAYPLMKRLYVNGMAAFERHQNNGKSL